MLPYLRYWNVFRTGATTKELMMVTKIMSFLIIVVGVSVALESELDFVEFLWIGNGILGSLVPVYLGMFFHNLQALEVFIAMLVNIAVVLYIQIVRWYPHVGGHECLETEAGGICTDGCVDAATRAAKQRPRGQQGGASHVTHPPLRLHGVCLHGVCLDAGGARSPTCLRLSG